MNNQRIILIIIFALLINQFKSLFYSRQFSISIIYYIHSRRLSFKVLIYSPQRLSLSPPRIIISSPLLHLKASYSSSVEQQASRAVEVVLKNPIILFFLLLFACFLTF